jgi:hypothetical protein
MEILGFSFTIISRASSGEEKRYSVLMGQTLKSPSRVEHFDFAIIPATETFFFFILQQIEWVEVGVVPC